MCVCVLLAIDTRGLYGPFHVNVTLRGSVTVTDPCFQHMFDSGPFRLVPFQVDWVYYMRTAGVLLFDDRISRVNPIPRP